MWSQTHSAFWLRFLERYKEHKCLWSKNSKDFNNKKKRSEAYADLVSLAKKIEPDADLMFVRRRIESFRNSFRRQSKKAIAARENGFEYQCSAYYFNLLKSFLDPFPAEESQDSDSNTESQFYNEQFSSNFGDEEEFIDENTSASIKKELHQEEDVVVQKWEILSDDNSTKQKLPYSLSRKRPRSSGQTVETDTSSRNRDRETEVQRKQNHLPEDECELLGQRLATHFRSMKPAQRLMAEKIISDVCIFGRMGKLTLDSGLMVDFADDAQTVLEEECVSEDNEIELHPEAYMSAI